MPQSSIYIKRFTREFPCRNCHKKIKVIENHEINLKIEKCGCGTFRMKIQRG